MTAIAKSQFFRSAGWRALESVAGESLGFLTFVLMARLLGIEDFGLMAVCTATLIVFQSQVQHGLPEAMIQSESLPDDALPTILRVSLRNGLLLGLGLVGVGAGLASLLNRPLMFPILCAMAPTLVVNAASAPFSALLRRQMRFRNLSIRTLVATSVGGMAGLSSALAGAGVWALVAQQWAAVVAGLLVLVGAGVVRLDILWKPGVRPADLRPLWRIARPIRLSELASNSARRLDTLMIAAFLGDRDVGLYFLATRLILSVSLVGQLTIAEVALPFLSQERREVGVDRNRAALVLRSVTVVCCAAYGALLLVVPAALPFVFGPRWSEAVVPLQILALGAIFGAYLPVTASTLVSVGAARTSAALICLVAALQVFAAWTTARYGLTVLAATVGAGQVAAAFLAFCCLVREPALRLAREVRALLPSLASCCVVLAGLAAAERFVDAPEAGLLFAVAYLIFVAWLGIRGFRTVPQGTESRRSAAPDHAQVAS